MYKYAEASNYVECTFCNIYTTGGLVATGWPSGEGSGVRVAYSGFESLVVLMFPAGTLPNNSGWLLSP